MNSWVSLRNYHENDILIDYDGTIVHLHDYAKTKVFVTPDVNYIDCSWFTTIIRTEGFKVRGHFRLQPCGTGRKDHKLIYINEFEKHGYVRRAKIEKQS